MVSREEGEAIYRATLESLLASTGWTPRAAEERAREEQRAHVRQMRWAREHGRGEPVRCFDAEEYDEGDDAFDALFDGGSGYGWDSPSGGGAFFNLSASCCITGILYLNKCLGRRCLDLCT